MFQSYWLKHVKKPFGNSCKDQMSNSSIYLSFFLNFELIAEGEHVCVLKDYSFLTGWRNLISQIIIYILITDTDNYLTNNHLHTN